MHVVSRWLLLCFFSAVHLTALAQVSHFESAVLQVIDGFNQQDANKVNSLIDKKMGIIVLNRRGVIDRLAFGQNIDFNNPIPEYLPYSGIRDDISRKITSADLPRYDCDKETWSKKGIYFIDANKNPLFMRIVDFLIQYNEAEISPIEYQHYQFINNNSRRIVAVDAEGYGLVFYLTQIDNAWYLTVIDRVSDDCGA